MEVRQQQDGTAAESIPLQHDTETIFTVANQSRKMLRFKPTATVQTIDCAMTEGERSRSYYNMNEMKMFSLEAKAIILSKELPNVHSDCKAYTTVQDSLVRLEADPALRGLEKYLCPVRVQNKRLARKALFVYHKKMSAVLNKTSEEKAQILAEASAKLSRWSKLAALETARLDSLQAYGLDYFIPIDEQVYITPFLVPNKRRRRTSNKDSQSVKRRRKN
eukprot:CAMPEP_0201660498 /NCGR_PEP_ID=MMETSP0494-20130426/3138_1 /ASSEMBLY_ACC=CAM_ASM_000839 /TAXON_ID=420259 /ORGANISM="Thalassiosira gravida, Strain GMp14c1" /LENGTH=219 /DNA_ID=CAMNT_0048138395 /DNA_START=14 /DNA_END=673 /DNA_ORIENTATION=-